MDNIRDPVDLAVLAARIYHQNKGNVTVKYLSQILGVSEAQLNIWKREHKWEKFAKPKDDVSKAFRELERMADSDLTSQQIAFCHNYIKSFNAMQALITAGYSPENANVVACKMLKDKKIKAYLRRLKKCHDIDDFLSTQRILDRHKKIAFADMSAFFNENGTPKPFSQVDGTLIKKVSIKTGKINEFTIELEDRAKSLDFLTKFYGLDPKLELEKQKSKLIDGAEDAEVVTIVDDISGGE